MRVKSTLPIVLVVASALVACAPAPAAAQMVQTLMDPHMLMDPPEATADVRPFVWRPALELTNLGWDSNVFNLPDEPDRLPADELPKGDFVSSFAAGIAPIWRPGAVRIAGAGGVAYNYFHRFERERGFDFGARGRIEVPVSRARLHAGGSYFDLRQRLNYEIDARARRTERDVTGGVEFALGSRATLDVEARRNDVLFDEDAPEVQYVRDALNREERTFAASFEYEITPFTNFVVTGARGEHTFLRSPLRSGDSDAVQAGLSLSSEAVISGRGTFGWRRMTIINPLIPAFSGPIADVNVSTVLGISTRLSLHGKRDVTFSVGEQSPYYVQTQGGASLAQALGEKWETGARFERVLLDYVQPVNVPEADYREYVDVFGGSVGYRFPSGFRISLEAELMRRDASTNPGRTYNTVRFYTVISTKAWHF